MFRNLQQRSLELLLPTTALAGVLLWTLCEMLAMPWDIIRFSLFLILFPIGSAWIMVRSRKIAIQIILLEYTGTAILAAQTFGNPLALALLAIPSSLVTIFYGVQPGIVASFIASGLILTLTLPHDAEALGTIFPSYSIIWGLQAILYSVVDSARGSLEWAWGRYQEMQSLLDDALDQRVELKQTRDDLVHANVQLERLAERLAAMTQIAEEAGQAKEQFLANVSHELRTPLNMILGFSEMIAQSPQIYESTLPGSLLADIAVIRRNSQHLASLVDDILDLSRAEAGQMALSKEWSSLQEIVDSATVAVRPLFSSKNLYLCFEMDEDLVVYCDRTRIRQVILNLLSNAGRLTEEGGATIRISQHNDMVICSVADTGPGISPIDQERIWQPFSQAGPQLQRNMGGSGLGLSISRQFVELHGGRMWLESQLGVGTSFFFTLPLVPPPLPGMLPLSRWFSAYDEYKPRDHASRLPHQEPVPRLVVLESGSTLARMLRRHGGDVEVIQTRRVEQAVEELQKVPAQALVINDELAESALRRMPELRDLPYGTPAVLCWLPTDEEAAARLGVLRYLVKPIRREELVRCLDGLGASLSKILIVDDDVEAVQLLARMILSASQTYRIIRASGAKRALSLMREEKPGLVLLDLYMPGMDGYQLLQQKAADPHIAGIPTVIISAHDPIMNPKQGSCITVVQHGPLALHDLLGTLRMVTSSDVESPVPPDPAHSAGPVE
jgi:signal transduction histidine kinase/CheY-like chemotaxis protein